MTTWLNLLDHHASDTTFKMTFKERVMERIRNPDRKLRTVLISGIYLKMFYVICWVIWLVYKNEKRKQKKCDWGHLEYCK